MTSTTGPNRPAMSAGDASAIGAAYMLEFLERSAEVRSLVLTDDALTKHLAEQVVLDHGGLSSTGVGIPVGTTPALAPGMELGWPRRCFANAYRAMGAELLYTEGWAAVPGSAAVPVHHAWLTSSNGFIYDPTWARDFAGRPTHYLGVRFSAEFMQQHHVDHGDRPVLEMNVRLLDHGLTFDHEHIATGYAEVSSQT